MATRIGVVTFPGTLDDRDAARAVRLAGGEAPQPAAGHAGGGLTADVPQAAVTGFDAMLEAGRVIEVTELYKTLRTKFAFVSNLGDVLQPREAALRWIGKTAPAL